MKKAKTNIMCGDKYYVKGQLYTSKEVAYLDQNDFEDVTDEPITVIITQEDLDENPILAENGLEVGDVGIVTDETVDFEEPVKKTKKSKK